MNLGPGCVNIIKQQPLLVVISAYLLSTFPSSTAKLLMFSVCSNLTVETITLDMRNNYVCFWCLQDEENGNEKGKCLSASHDAH